MSDSMQHKLDRVRKPRVHITYDVEIGGAIQKRELPFVVGVLGHYHGSAKLPPLKQREFLEIDRDNFDKVMEQFNAELDLTVENTLQGDGSQLPVRLKIRSLRDLEPGGICEQVEPLKKLLEKRNKIKELLSNIDLYPQVAEALEEALAKILNT